MYDAPVRSGRQFAREEREDYRRMEGQPRQLAQRWQQESVDEEGGIAAVRAVYRRQVEPREDHRQRERPLWGGAFAIRREQMGGNDWEEERQRLLAGGANAFANEPARRR